MLEELIPLTDYKDIVIALAERGGYSVREVNGKYHIAISSFWNSPTQHYELASEQYKCWADDFIHETEMGAWKHALYLMLLDCD